MDNANLPTVELLKKLLRTRVVQRRYRGLLRPLFNEAAACDGDLEGLRVARELIKRWLSEELKEQCVFSQPSLVREYLRVMLSDREHECFVVLFLDAQNRLICSEELFRGTLTQTSVYPREVVKRALAVNAAATIFAHNHPSGVAEPSHADEMLTQALKQALALVDVKALDHFIVAGNTALSFAERGLL